MNKNLNIFYKFLDIYKNERKFFKIGSRDIHVNTFEVKIYIDEHLVNFLEIIFINIMMIKLELFF